MKLDLKFKENAQSLELGFGQYQDLTDGGYERGYAAGYADGETYGKIVISGILDETATDFENPYVSYLRKFGLAFNNAIKSVNFENVQSTGEHVFYQCYQLSGVRLPNLTTPGTYAFRDCTALKELELPKVSVFTYGICQNAKNLVLVDTSSVTKIDNAAFLDCISLVTLILRYNKVATLSATRAFQNTPIASGTGYIYVPDNLVEQYKVATNWSTYASQIKPLSELGE